MRFKGIMMPDLRRQRIAAGFATTGAFARALGLKDASSVQLWELGKRAVPSVHVKNVYALLRHVPPPPPRTPFMRGCADRTCGTCVRCVRAAAWARGGGYVNRPHGFRASDWSSEQDERLRELADRMDRRQIAETLTREFPEHPPRTAIAVSMRARRLGGLNLWAPGMSLKEVGTLLGVSGKRVRTWISLGWLQTFPCEWHGSNVRVMPDAVADFIRHHSEHYDVRRVQGVGPLVELARLYAVRRVPRRCSKPVTRRTSNNKGHAA